MNRGNTILTADSGQRVWYPEINIMRAILIILVVVGHVTLQMDTDNLQLRTCLNIIGETIYSFHMPAFFVIAGFCAIKSVESENKWGYVKKRWTNLMIPYLTMSLVYIPFRLSLSVISRTKFEITDSWKILIGDSPDGALWFLYALFIISSIVCLLASKKNFKLILVASILLYLISSLVSWPFGIIGKLFGNTPFYLIGLLLRYNYEKYKDMLHRWGWIFAFCFVGFVVGNIVLQLLQIEMFRLLTSLTGFVVLLNISDNIGNKVAIVRNSLNTIGYYGMDIYIFSEPFKVVIRTALKFLPDILNVAITICLTVTVLILMSKYIVRKSNLLSRLFIGKSV